MGYSSIWKPWQNVKMIKYECEGFKIVWKQGIFWRYNIFKIKVNSFGFMNISFINCCHFDFLIVSNRHLNILKQIKTIFQLLYLTTHKIEFYHFSDKNIGYNLRKRRKYNTLSIKILVVLLIFLQIYSHIIYIICSTELFWNTEVKFLTKYSISQM